MDKLEKSLQREVDTHKVYNLATCRKWVLRSAAELRIFEKPYCNKARFCVEAKNCFGYNWHIHPIEYNNKLTVEPLHEVLTVYAQAFFIYCTQTYVISNYSVRTDNIRQDCGNFPLWNNELFRRDARLLRKQSHFSHILDQDMLRLGKTVIEHNPNVGALDFGVILITEIGKERPNTKELNDRARASKAENSGTSKTSGVTSSKSSRTNAASNTNTASNTNAASSTNTVSSNAVTSAALPAGITHIECPAISLTTS